MLHRCGPAWRVDPEGAKPAVLTPGGLRNPLNMIYGVLLPISFLTLHMNQFCRSDRHFVHANRVHDVILPQISNPECEHQPKILGEVCLGCDAVVLRCSGEINELNVLDGSLNVQRCEFFDYGIQCRY